MARTIVRLASLVAAVLGCAYARAQNLVPNPSFESYLKCPTADYQFDGYVANWKSCTKDGSPDYFNACNKDLCSQNVPAARYGYQSAHDSARGGAAFAGIYFTNISANYREYIGTKLTAPLVKGEWYMVRFYVSLAEASPVATMNLGAYICSDSTIAHTLVYPAKPQIVYPQFITTSDGWVEISGLYQARGGEDHIIIGCFDQVLRTTPSGTHGACASVKWDGAYYYIDDVSLAHVDAPACSASSDNYDIEFHPAAASDARECCWDVVVTAKQGACPLYGVNAFLPSGTMPFTWRTDAPVMPGETRTIGGLCLDESVNGGEILVTYLNDRGMPVSGTSRELHCAAVAPQLTVRTPISDGGSSDFCAYDLYVDNTGDAPASLEELLLDINGSEFQDWTSADWWTSGTPNEIIWQYGNGALVIPPRSSIHVGKFSVGASSAREALTAILREHQIAGAEGEPEKGIDVPLEPCTFDQHRSLSGVVATSPGADAARLALAPNPAPSGTTITYRVARDGEIGIELFDLNGKMVRKIAEGYRDSGEHTLRYDTEGLPAGIYRLRMRSSDGTALATLIVSR
jgi:hypothetical protein